MSGEGDIDILEEEDSPGETEELRTVETKTRQGGGEAPGKHSALSCF